MMPRENLKEGGLLILAAWFGLCLGGIVPQVISGDNSGHYWLGLSAMMAVAGYTISLKSGRRRQMIVFFTAWGICLILTPVMLLPSMVSVTVYCLLFSFISLTFGLCAGALFVSHGNFSVTWRHIRLVYPGIAIAAMVNIAFDFSLPQNAGEKAAAENPALLWVTFMVPLLAVLVTGVFSQKLKQENIPAPEPTSALNKYSLLFFWVFVLAVVLEVVVVFWSVAYMEDHQGVISRLTFPCFILAVYIVRLFSGRRLSYFCKPGWHVALAFIAMISTGYFYTFSITPLFILLGGLSFGLFLPVHMKLYHFYPDRKQLFYSFGVIAAVFLITGLYSQNHVDYIVSIGMPSEVIGLSARQAIIKELTALAALAMIGSGWLFLKRGQIAKSD